MLNATGSSDRAAVEGGRRFRTKQTAARVAAESETRLRVVAQILALLKLERLATQCGTAALARARASHSVELRKYFRLPSNLKRASGIPGHGTPDGNRDNPRQIGGGGAGWPVGVDPRSPANCNGSIGDGGGPGRGVDPRSPANRAGIGGGDGPPIVGVCRAGALSG